MSTVSEKRKVIADAQKFAAQFGGFIDAVMVLKDVADIETATQEAQNRLDATRKALASADDDLKAKTAEVDAEIAGIKAEANKAIASANAVADNVIAAANERSEEIIAQANAAAAKIKAVAKSESASLQMQIDGMKADIAMLGEETERAQQTKVAAENLASEAADKLAAAEKKYGDFLQKIGAR